MILAGIKKDKSIIKKKKKHDKIILLGKEKLSSIEVLISKALIDSYVSHDVFVSANNVLIKKVWVIKKNNGNLLCQLKENTANKNWWKIINAFIKLCCLWQEKKSTFIKKSKTFK